MSKLKIKIDPGKALGYTVTALGLMVTLLSNKAEEYNRNAMKEELKKDILKDLSSK